MSKSRVLGSLAGYALIALSAYFTLEREMLWAVWIFTGGLALKTLIASQKLRAEHAAQAGEGGGAHEIQDHHHQDGAGQ